MKTTERRPWFEAAAVAATGLLHLAFLHAIGLRIVFIATACVAWAAYVVVRVARDRGQLARWGFGLAGFRETAIVTAVISAAALAAMAAIGAARGTLALSPHMLVLALLYPIWGVVQQFLVQGLLAGNLVVLEGSRPRARYLATAVAAVLFGMIHLPDWQLAVATFLMGLAFTPTYLRFKNLWPLGAAHGWLGIFMYFWVLGRDPWLEILRGSPP